jgi:hypothetical protein
MGCFYAPTAGRTTTFFRPRKKHFLPSGGFPTAKTRCTTTPVSYNGVKRRANTHGHTVTGVDHRASGNETCALEIYGFFVR